MVAAKKQMDKNEFEGLQLSGTESDVTSKQSGTESDGAQEPKNRYSMRWVVAGLAVTAILATALYSQGFRKNSGPAPGPAPMMEFSPKYAVQEQSVTAIPAAAGPAAPVPKADAMASAIPCTSFPYMKILSPPFWRNLGQAGPDYGEEGMYFNVTMSNVGTVQTEAQLIIHADQGYVPSWNEFNGINGEYVRINFNSGTAAGFTLYFLDKATNTKMTIPRGYLTFADMDGGPNSKEFVAFDATPFTDNSFFGNLSGLTESTAINPNPAVQSMVDPGVYSRTLVFSGTGVDLGADNPSSGDVLSTRQKNNAVTLQIGAGLTELKFKLGATAGSTSRTVQFTFQPTLLCASTLMPDGTLKAPLDPAFAPKTNKGEAVDASKFATLGICTSDCAPPPGAAAAGGAVAAGGTTAAAAGGGPSTT